MSWRPSSRRWRRPTLPSISASRRPRSSCCPSPTATCRRWPRRGGRRPTACRRCGWPASSDCAIRCRSTSMSRRVAAHARLVVVRCLGGLDYWRYGLECLADLARDRGVLLAACPATIARIRAWRRSRPSRPRRWPVSAATSARAARTIFARRCAMPRRCSAATSRAHRPGRSARSRCSGEVRRPSARSRSSSSTAPICWRRTPRR